MAPKAILFDLDNTLTHRALSIDRYAERFLHEFKIEIAEADARQISHLIARIDNGGYLRPESEYSSIREAVGYTLAQELKWTGPVDPKRLIAHWMNHFPSAAVEMPGASAMVQALHRKGIALGVISNGAEHSRRQTLAALPFGETIETMICSETCGIAKPTPGIFHLGAQALGVRPEHCWFVGDHPQNDYLGATAAGMLAVWLSGFHPWPASITPAERSIKTLEGLLDMLAT